jgi:hypothetical protein
MAVQIPDASQAVGGAPVDAYKERLRHKLR